MSKPKSLLMILLVSVISQVEMSQDLMKTLTIQFAKPMELCLKEMELSDAVAAEFANFWKEGYKLTDRHTGCAIMCMSSKLDILDAEYRFHHGKAQDFLKKHGADDDVAQKLIDIMHQCIQSVTPDKDPCLTTVYIAQCFKDKIHELNWNPNHEAIMAELLAQA